MKQEPLIKHIGVAVPLLIDNVDTDQIIPSREMKTTGRTGLSGGLFAGWRYDSPADRTELSNFVLNKPAYQGASILLSSENFGCGSSREHAVWALSEYGFRIIIAISFGEIFYGNCIRNGILPISLERYDLNKIANWVSQDPQANRIEVDLLAQTIATDDGSSCTFEINAYAKRLLVEGLDPIGLTLISAARITEFHHKDKVERPWIYV